MPAILRLDKSGLNSLIDSIKANGGDPGELNDLLDEVLDDERNRRPVKREKAVRVMVEEPTTEERLKEEVGALFLEGITGKVLSALIEMDRNYTLAELKKMAVEAGLSPSGHKKELAARLLAKGVK
ncbi:hypothetical protein LCGC14_0765220 [marine sediment metagenome]|uniref:SAP domain-containing protein n=1 Tax=marine sediment metagenome TaxID=412755 RepID=A0A0F9Q487_9ZZZZ